MSNRDLFTQCMHDHARKRSTEAWVKFLLRGGCFGWVERLSDGGKERRKHGVMEAMKVSEQTVAVAHGYRRGVCPTAATDRLAKRVVLVSRYGTCRSIMTMQLAWQFRVDIIYKSQLLGESGGSFLFVFRSKFVGCPNSDCLPLIYIRRSVYRKQFIKGQCFLSSLMPAMAGAEPHAVYVSLPDIL